jgi:C-terminal processing protease CtpA/Prc
MNAMTLKDLIRQKLDDHFLWRDRLARLDWSLLPDEPTVAEANQFLKMLQDWFTGLKWTPRTPRNPIGYCGLGAMLWPRFTDRNALPRRDAGLPVTNADGYPLLRWILPSTPASEKDLRIGDALLTIDGQDVVNVPLSRLSRLVLGSEGSSIDLEIIPADGGKVRSVSLVRRTVELPLLFTQQEAGIDYLHPPRLNLKTAASNFGKIVGRLTGWALIFDLRGFTGCDLNTFRQLAAPFFPANQILARREDYVRGRLVSSEILCPGCDEGIFAKPVAVLSGNKTLSGGEGLVGAFKHYKQATIIGEDTGGKGVYQIHFNLRGQRGRNLQMSVTAGRFYSPDNQWPGDGNFELFGIAPDYLVRQTSENVMPGMVGDAQYDYAVNHLQRLRSSG